MYQIKKKNLKIKLLLLLLLQIFRLLTSLLLYSNVLANVSVGLHQMFHVELENPHRTTYWTLYLIFGVDCTNSVNHDQKFR